MPPLQDGGTIALKDAGGDSCCTDAGNTDAGAILDAGTCSDAGPIDSGATDAGATLDAGATDAGAILDAGTHADGGSTGGHGDPVDPELASLLDELEGWGAGTTGGRDGTIFVVDSLEDSLGPRSLRTALTSDEPLWIVFAEGIDGVVELLATINIKSNKTVDARGHQIRIRTSHAGPEFTAFKIVSQSNLVFTNLRLDDEIEDWDADSEGSDGMTIVNSQQIWIHHCRFSRWRDGAIDMRYDSTLPGGPPSRISVTWSRFDRTYQALNWTADLASLGHTYCTDVRRRCVQIIGGHAHSYNNVIEDWNAPTIQNAKEGAELLSERNIFVPGTVDEVNSRETGSKIRLLNNHAVGNVAFLGGSDTLDAAFEGQSRSLAVIENCSSGDDACWNNLRTRVQTYAGAQ